MQIEIAIAAAGLELLYQRLMFKGSILHFMMILFSRMVNNKILYYIAKPLGLCHRCNWIWIFVILYAQFYDLGLQMVIPMSISYITLELLFHYIPGSIYLIKKNKL